LRLKWNFGAERGGVEWVGAVFWPAGLLRFDLFNLLSRNICHILTSGIDSPTHQWPCRASGRPIPFSAVWHHLTDVNQQQPSSMATKHSLILDDTNRDGISFPYVFFFSSSLTDYYDLISLEK
jgi:hypothetical protein